MLDDLTVIIPVGANETAWRILLKDLETLPPSAEVLLVGVDSKPGDFDDGSGAQLPCETRWLQSAAGRARQLNYGAENSTRSFLWFLHADSQLDSVAIEKLDRALRNRPSAIHYFVLAFQSDGPRVTRLNSWGANLRSRWLRMPFGDQGFCVSKNLFRALGGFDELARYGEDHLFIWKAHRMRMSVSPIEAQISTSARKYRREGWLRTTCIHLWRTVSQALPQFIRLLVGKTQ